jgi:hypothetical protein
MYGIAPNIRTAKADMPRIISKTKATSYYWLNATWLAYQTFHTCNYGHVLWDTFLPIHTIIEMFHLMGDIFVTRLPFEGDCPSVHGQLEVPFFGITLSKRPFENLNNFIPNANSRYVCAREGASGYGALNDHYMNQHGWKKEDLEFPHNIGRGPELRRLRARILRGLYLPGGRHFSQQPVLITFRFCHPETGTVASNFRKKAKGSKLNSPLPR